MHHIGPQPVGQNVSHTPAYLQAAWETQGKDWGYLGAGGGVLLPLPHQEKATLGGELRRNGAKFPPPGIINDLD